MVPRRLPKRRRADSDAQAKNDATKFHPFQARAWVGIRSQQDRIERYFEGPAPTRPLRDIGNGYDDRAGFLGHPWPPKAARLKGVNAESFKPVAFEVEGCGPAFDQVLRARVHPKLKALAEAAFKRIAELNDGRYYFWYVGSFYARYMKPDSIKAIVRDDEDAYARGALVYRRRSEKKGREYEGFIPVEDRHSSRKSVKGLIETKAERAARRRAAAADRGQWADSSGGGSWVSRALKDDFHQDLIMQSKVSNHSFGTAFDLNPGRNPHQTGARFDMPPWIVRIFHQHGYDWGGYYRTCDYMHFEYMQSKVLPVPLYGAREWVQPIEQSADAIYTLNEAGQKGFYPVGSNRLWHGGVHLATDSALRSIAEGEVVAARLAEGPKDEGAAPGWRGTTISRNFVLIRHELRVEEGGQQVSKWLWCLFMHLRPFAYTSEDTAAPAWLAQRLKSYRGFCASHAAVLPALDWGKRYYVVELAEDPQIPSKRRGAGYGLRLRQQGRREKDRKPIAVLPPGTLVEILKPPNKKGNALVRIEAGDQSAGVSTGDGTLLSEPLEGLIHVWPKGKKKVKRVTLVDPTPFKVIHDLRSGKVVAFDVPVAAGEQLGLPGHMEGLTGAHVEVFSEENLCPLVKELGSWTQLEDPNDDRFVDVKVLESTIASLSGWLDETTRLRIAAKAARDMAVRSPSEWGVRDRGFLETLPLVKLGGDAARRFFNAQIDALQWWDQAEAALRAQGRKAALPRSRKVWHYHPVTLVACLQQAFTKGSGSLYRDPPAPPAQWRDDGAPAPKPRPKVSAAPKPSSNFAELVEPTESVELEASAPVVATKDPAPVKKRGSKLAFEPTDMADPRHVIFKAVADTEGGYNTVNMWDNAICSWGIGQWVMHLGKLQNLLDFVRWNHPKDYKRLVQKELGLDLPAKRKNRKDLRVIVAGRTLSKNARTAEQKKLLKKIKTVAGGALAGKIRHEIEFAEFEETFRGMSDGYVEDLLAVARRETFSKKDLQGAIDAAGGSYKARAKNATTKGWIRLFKEAGAEPIMQQCQYEYKCFNLIEDFLRNMPVYVKKGSGLLRKMEGDYVPEPGTYGKMHEWLGGDLWLQLLSFSLFVNATYMFPVLLAGAIKALAAEKGVAPKLSALGDRKTWRNDFVRHVELAVEHCTYRMKTGKKIKSGKFKGTSWRAWRDSRLPKALKAYQALTKDQSAERDQSIAGLTFDADGKLTGPAVTVRAHKNVLVKMAKIQYRR